MSDYNSSLPVRTENAGDVISKIADATTPSQQLTVNPDGSINVTDNGASFTVDATDLDIRDLDAAQDNIAISDGTDTLAVNTDGSINITDNGGSITVDASNLDIRDLVFATDKVDASGSVVALDAPTLAALESITVQNGAGASAVNIQDGGNSITVDGTVELGATTLAALESITVQNTSGAGAVNIQDGGNSITVDATDLDIRDLTHVSDSVKIGDGTDFLAVNTDGSINVVISDATPGTPINNYNTAAAVASGATSTHSYTVTAGETFYFNQIEASGTGKMKIEVQVNAVTKFVQFNSTANTNMSIHIENPIVATAGQVVSIIRTNRENQAQDLYSTISGYELP